MSASENEIKAFMAQKLNEQITLNEVHKLLKSELNVSMTFMELRMLSTELDDIDWSQFDPQKEELNEDTTDETSPEVDLNKVSIDVSTITVPGTMASGKVKFPVSNNAGEWSVDTMGQLGMKLDDESNQPSQEEMMEFQTVLRTHFEKGGF